MARVVLAARLGLFGDEAFYYLCSQHPALAYADPPLHDGAVGEGVLLEAATGLFGVPDLREPFVARERVLHHVDLRLDARDPPELLIADSIALGGSLALAFDRRLPVYVLQHPDDLRHGRHAQLERWEIGEEALAERVGEDAMLVLEHRGRRARRERIHARSFLEPAARGRLKRVDAELPGEPRIFDLYRGRVVDPSESGGSSDRS